MTVEDYITVTSWKVKSIFNCRKTGGGGKNEKSKKTEF